MAINVFVPFFRTFSARGGFVWYLGLRCRLPQADLSRTVGASVWTYLNLRVDDAFTISTFFKPRMRHKVSAWGKRKRSPRIYNWINSNSERAEEYFSENRQ